MDSSSEQKIPPEFVPHFTGLTEGQVRFPKCRECGKFHWYPMPLCPHCRSASIEWTATSGHASLYSWTVVRHAFSPSLRDQIPYVVALVTFDDAPGVRLITNLLDVSPPELQCDMLLKPEFQYKTGESPSVKFRPM